MKKIYPITLCLFSALSFAQQRISFENAEGFYTGSIQAQGAWISTPTGDDPPNVLNQTICADEATDGYYSLKIVKENTYGTQPVPIIGAFNNVQIMLPSTAFSVSFDINMSQLNGSVFGFQAMKSAEEKFIVRVDFDHSGSVKILNSPSSSEMVTSSGSWQPNMWSRFKVVGSSANLKYYLDDVLIYTGPAAESLNIDQLRFVHDNAEGSAYIDNIQVNNETGMLSSKDMAIPQKIKIYPNPAADVIRIDPSNDLKGISIYDMSGNKYQVKAENGTVNIKNLPAGIYLIHILTKERNFTEKFTKK